MFPSPLREANGRRETFHRNTKPMPKGNRGSSRRARQRENGAHGRGHSHRERPRENQTLRLTTRTTGPTQGSWCGSCGLIANHGPRGVDQTHRCVRSADMKMSSPCVWSCCSQSCPRRCCCSPALDRSVRPRPAPPGAATRLARVRREVSRSRAASREAVAAPACWVSSVCRAFASAAPGPAAGAVVAAGALEVAAAAARAFASSPRARPCPSTARWSSRRSSPGARLISR